MAREYPRFLFSNPQNTKSKGPFVVHTMEPHIIVGVFSSPIDNAKYSWTTTIEPKKQFIYVLALLSKHQNLSDEKSSIKFQQTLKDLKEWLYFQIKDGHIDIK